MRRIKNCYEKLDFLKFQRKGQKSRFCLVYYIILYFSAFIFVIFTYFFIFTHISHQTSEKDLRLKKAIDTWENRNLSLGIQNISFLLKFHQINNTNTRLVHKYHLKYFKNNENSLKHIHLYEQHSFPSEFFILDISESIIGLILGNISFSSKATWKRNIKSDICLEILHENHDNKQFSIKKQKSCQFLNSKGILVNLWKMFDEKLHDIKCNSKNECKKICIEHGLLYYDENYLLDKSMSTPVLTCQKPYITHEICFIVKLDDYGGLSYHGGCYNGLIERYFPAEINKYYELNRTKFFIREPLDPYIEAVNLGGYKGDFLEIYEMRENSKNSSLKTVFILGLWITLVVLIGFVIKRVRKKYKKIETVGFNKYEMSSANIKL